MTDCKSQKTRIVTAMYDREAATMKSQLYGCPNLSFQPSPERKATHSILSLVSCFVLIYWLNNCFTLYSFYSSERIPRVESINAILTTCYPTICPFLFMKNNKVILQFISSFSIQRMTCFQSSIHG